MIAIRCFRRPRYKIGIRKMVAIKYRKNASEIGSVSLIIKRVATIESPALRAEIAAAIFARITLFIF